MIPRFDPTRTGPLDLYRRFRDWSFANYREITVTVLFSLILWGFASARWGWSLPSFPQWLWVVIFASVGGAILGIYPVIKVIRALYSENVEKIAPLDATTGDRGVIEISEDRFADMTVLDHNGNEQETTYLHQITLLSGERAYEVDYYDEERNVAVSSWMAGATNRDIRRHKFATDYIKRELSREADKALDALVNSKEAVRSQGKLVANHIIRTVEGVDTPGDKESEIYSEMFDVVEEADESESLLNDTGSDDLDSQIAEFVSSSDAVDGEAIEDPERVIDKARSVQMNGDADTSEETA